MAKIVIGRPAFSVAESVLPETGQRQLQFIVSYPKIEAGLQPRHRFMSAFEQRVDLPADGKWQYLIIAAAPYENIAFKIPSGAIDKRPGAFDTNWDAQAKTFTLSIAFLTPEQAKAAEEAEQAAKTAREASGVHAPAFTTV